MKLRILQPFAAPDSPRPFLPGELVDVADRLGTKWVAAGLAARFQPSSESQAAVPARRSRETATL